MSRSNQEFNFCFQDKMNRYMRSKHVKFNFDKLGKMKQKNILMKGMWKASMPNLTLKNWGKWNKNHKIFTQKFPHGPCRAGRRVVSKYMKSKHAKFNFKDWGKWNKNTKYSDFPHEPWRAGRKVVSRSKR